MRVSLTLTVAAHIHTNELSVTLIVCCLCCFRIKWIEGSDTKSRHIYICFPWYFFLLTLWLYQYRTNDMKYHLQCTFFLKYSWKCSGTAAPSSQNDARSLHCRSSCRKMCCKHMTNTIPQILGKMREVVRKCRSMCIITHHLYLRLFH